MYGQNDFREVRHGGAQFPLPLKAEYSKPAHPVRDGFL
jgi:hypothetical protein